MAHFYGTISTDRGSTSRTGHKTMTAHARGWDIGGEVRLSIDKAGRDVVELWITSGSNGSRGARLVGRFVCDEHGNPVKVED